GVPGVEVARQDKARDSNVAIAFVPVEGSDEVGVPPPVVPPVVVPPVVVPPVVVPPVVVPPVVVPPVVVPPVVVPPVVVPPVVVVMRIELRLKYCASETTLITC